MLSINTAQQLIALITAPALRDLVKSRNAVLNKIHKRKKDNKLHNSELYELVEKITRKYVRMAEVQKNLKDHARGNYPISQSDTQALRSFVKEYVRNTQYALNHAKVYNAEMFYLYGYTKQSAVREVLKLKRRIAIASNIQRKLSKYKDYINSNHYC